MLDESAIGEAGTSKKSKKTQATTITKWSATRGRDAKRDRGVQQPSPK
jgi:hypothetical protein